MVTPTYEAVPGLIVGEGVWGYDDPSPDPPTEQEIIDVVQGGGGGYVTLDTAQTITGQKTFSAVSAATVGLIVKGASLQSANLQEWQGDGGGIKAAIAADGYAWFGSATTPGGMVGVTPFSATSKGIVVRGVASQSGNLTEWQNSAGTVLTNVDASGNIVLNATGTRLDIGASNIGGFIRAGNSTPRMRLTSEAATQTLLELRGAASQTADLQQWKDSGGSVRASVSSGGVIRTEDAFLARTGGYGAVLNIGTAASGTVAAIIRGAAAQTADLQQWQDSAGTVLVSISNVGTITAPQLRGAVNQSYLDLSGVTATFKVAGTTQVPLAVKGIAAQTADLTQWQNSAGTVLTYINASGRLVINPAANQYSGASIFGSTSGGTVSLQAVASAATIIPIDVVAAAAQTADLQQWRDSAGTVLTRITSTGVLQFSTDTNLYRSAANVLKTDDNIIAAIDIIVRDGLSSRTAIGAVGPGSVAGIVFGSAADVSLYRSAADELGTDDALRVKGGLFIQGSSLLFRNSANNLSLFSVGTDGVPRWQNAGANQQTTVGAAGAASALPATPSVYFHVRDNANQLFVIPAYAAV